MKTTRRKFTSKFKAQVSIEAIKERVNMTNLAKRFEVHPAQITTWKREFLERADLAFWGLSDAPQLTALESECDDLNREVLNITIAKSITCERIIMELEQLIACRGMPQSMPSS